MSDAAWPRVQYGSPPPSDLDDTISDAEDAPYEYASEGEEGLASEEWLSDSDQERGDLGLISFERLDSDLEYQDRFVPDGLEPAETDSRFNNVRFQMRQLMYAVGRYKKGRTAYASFEQLLDDWGRCDFLPIDFETEGAMDDEDPDMGEAWWIPSTELRELIELAKAEDCTPSKMWSGGLEKWELALAHAPEELPDRREVDPETLD